MRWETDKCCSSLLIKLLQNISIDKYIQEHPIFHVQIKFFTVKYVLHMYAFHYAILNVI